MTFALAATCGLLGLLIGSFLNVVVWRVPRGESIVSPPSACPSCGHPIRPYDNVPVVSWLVLRGRCRDCGEPISVRYPLVEAGTGLAFGLVAWVIGLSWTLPAYLYFAAISIALSLIDLDTKRLPNTITLPSYFVTLLLLLLPAALDPNWDAYVRALLGGIALFAFYFLLAFVYPAGMGFGDVKLAGIIGLYLGWLGWGPVIVGAFLGFLLGAVVGGTLMLARRAKLKTAIPFGPFMLLGAWLAVLWGQALADLYTGAVF